MCACVREVVVYGCVCERGGGGGVWTCVRWWCMDVCVGVVVYGCVCEVVVYGCVCVWGGVWMCV